MVLERTCLEFGGRRVFVRCDSLAMSLLLFVRSTSVAVCRSIGRVFSVSGAAAVTVFFVVSELVCRVAPCRVSRHSLPDVSEQFYRWSCTRPTFDGRSPVRVTRPSPASVTNQGSRVSKRSPRGWRFDGRLAVSTRSSGGRRMQLRAYFWAMSSLVAHRGFGGASRMMDASLARLPRRFFAHLRSPPMRAAPGRTWRCLRPGRCRCVGLFLVPNRCLPGSRV